MSTPSGCELAKLFSDSYLFQSVLLSHLTASLITLFICYIGLKNFRGALFHWNCKILIITLFGCYIVHAISLIVTFGYHLFVFNFRSHCDMLVSGLFCHLTRGGANVIMIGSSYIHLLISFERLWAKYMDREYHEQNGLCGVISLIVILIFTLCTYIFFVRKDNLSDMTPYCSSVNKYTLNDSMIQAYCMLGVDFISTLIMASLHFFSWHENQRTHPRSYDLRSSFARVEHQASTSFLFPLTVLHCIVYILFSIFNLIIMNLGAYLDFITFRTIFSAVLLPPYHILLSSLLFIYLLRERKKKKVENLQSITRKVTNQREILMTYARHWILTGALLSGSFWTELRVFIIEMSDISACELAELFSNAYLFQAVLCSHIIASSATLVFCYFGMKSFRGAFFHWNCKILIITLFICYIVHSISIIVTFGYHLFVYNFFSPCDMLVSGLFCQLSRSGANIMLVWAPYLHLFICFERLYAKVMDGKYHEQSGICGIMSLVVVLALSIYTYVFFSRNDVLSDMTPYCSPANKHTMNDSLIETYIVLCVDFISALTMSSLHYCGRKQRGRTHSHSFTLKSSFAHVEHRASTEFLLPLTCLHCIVYMVFDSFNIIIMKVGISMDFLTFRTIFAAVFLPPYYTLLSSLLFIYLLKNRRKKKVEIMRVLTKKVTNQKEILMSYAHNW